MRHPLLARPLTRIAALLGTLCLFALLCPVGRTADGYPDEAIKAAYLYRFAGYVKWPSAHQSAAPFTIDVIGDGAVASELARLLPTHPINGHPAHVRIIRRISDLGDAQMLYIGTRFDGDVSRVIASVARRPILIVTDERRGLDDGGTINFVEAGRHVRFDVSLTAAGRAGLEISSELLSVAEHVRGGRVRSELDCLRGIAVGELDSGCAGPAMARRAPAGAAAPGSGWLAAREAPSRSGAMG